MEVIHLDQFRRPLPGFSRFMTVQTVWDLHPEKRPKIARELKGMCRSIAAVVLQAEMRK